MSKIPVGILGATGMVGQRFIQLLQGHPWFEITALAASEHSAGQPYAQACSWLLPTTMPAGVRELVLQPCQTHLDCRLVFSALPSQIARETEQAFALAGYAVCSNASAHRLDPDVPLLIPEVNPEHTALIEIQRRRRGWSGLLVTSANCLATLLTLALKPLQDAFGLEQSLVVSMQAISGAGYPGVAAWDILGNVIPYIPGEEEKVEQEPRKLLGTLHSGATAILQDVPSAAPRTIPPTASEPWEAPPLYLSQAPIQISAHCNRVPVLDGHCACVSLKFHQKPTVAQVIVTLEEFTVPPEIAKLPSTPERPLVVHQEEERPQPRRDVDQEHGMTVSVGRIRSCPLLDYKFVLLGHNTLRGAAGGAIHNAELLVAQGWVT
ncbi:MAG: aspartate-semialdehyde dehydrogenase family protein [Chloroflexia bacterium]|nr:aspartate-semialdehyde dehydrogenase family protein [Chloroflexia bacterium]